MNAADQKQDGRKASIVYFKPNLHGVDPLVKVALLWPCHAWSVSFRVKPQSPLDVFAELVLRLAELGVSPKATPYPAALPEPLLHIVCTRLVQDGCLHAASLEITGNGRRLLDAGAATEPATVTLFTDLWTGRLLPRVLTGPPRRCRGTFRKDGSVGFKAGATDQEEITAWVFEPAGAVEAPARPSSREAAAAIREHNSRCMRALAPDSSGGMSPVPCAGALSVESSEPVYLACLAVISKRNVGETLVTDGFGMGYSPAFSVRLNRENPAWWRERKRRALEEEVALPHGLEGERTDGAPLRYPAVTRLLRKLSADFHAFSREGEGSTMRETRRRDALGDILGGAYDAVEQTLARVVADTVSDGLVTRLGEMDMESKPGYVLDAARKIGLETARVGNLFGNLPPGKFAGIRRGRVEMAPLLALVIAAADADRNHPLAKLAEGEPDLLCKIARLAQLRNSFKHSAAEIPWALLGGENPEAHGRAVRRIHDFAYLVAGTLLPDIVRELPEDAGTSERVGQGLADALKSHLFLEDRFPAAFLAALPRGMQTSLQATSRKWVDMDRHKGDPIYQNRYVVQLAASVELALAHAISSLPREPETEPRAAAARMVAAGFYPSPEAVPLALLGGNRADKLARVLQSGRGTVGPCTLALFLRARADDLEQLHRACPNAVKLLASLVELRGHGNNLHGFSAEELAGLDGVFPLIRELGGIFIISSSYTQD